ncbi:MAG: DUF362 domain-containing protein [Elusimicrobiaceae bacterium]|nr:DUF362 domain-containing protein [Elusimicrobiaceae bacterium]
MKKIIAVIFGATILAACSSAVQKEAGAVQTAAQDKPIVYFTRDISPEGLVKIYDKISQNIDGKVAIKFHTGEPHGPNILPVPMVKALWQHIPNSTLVETNVFYNSPRQTTKGHRETLKTNGWTFSEVDILDEDGAVMLPVKGGKHFKEMSMGSHILNYDSLVVLTHFKGHAMGGYGGSMKNIAIGMADGKIGKKMIHQKGDEQWGYTGARFQENMAESAKATIDHFGDKIVYINVLRRMSVDCDCAGTSAAEPKAHDIGILASTNIVAVDQASLDQVYALPEAELHDLQERIESREGLRQISYMKELGLGNGEYTLVDIDK